jgi:hypothetical protein
MNIAIRRRNKGRDDPVCAAGNAVGEQSREARMLRGGSNGSLRLKGRSCQRERTDRSQPRKAGVSSQGDQIWEPGGEAFNTLEIGQRGSQVVADIKTIGLRLRLGAPKPPGALRRSVVDAGR